MYRCKLTDTCREKLLDHYLEYYVDVYGMDHPHKAEYINKYLLEQFNATPEPWKTGMPRYLVFPDEKQHTMFLLKIL